MTFTKEGLIDYLKKSGVLPLEWQEPDLLPHIGTKFYGYCNGYFDDDYDEKTVETIGFDWIVVRNEKGHPMMANLHPRNVLAEIEMIQEWMVRDEN